MLAAKHMSLRVIKICMFTSLDKPKAKTENLRGLNLAVIRLTSDHVIKLPM
jgi:hypothetical protein